MDHNKLIVVIWIVLSCNKLLSWKAYSLSSDPKIYLIQTFYFANKEKKGLMNCQLICGSWWQSHTQNGVLWISNQTFSDCLLSTFLTIGGKRKWVLSSSYDWLHNLGMEQKHWIFIKIWLQGFSTHRLELQLNTRQPIRSPKMIYTAILIAACFNRINKSHGLYLQVSDTSLFLSLRPKWAQKYKPKR